MSLEAWRQIFKLRLGTHLKFEEKNGLAYPRHTRALFVRTQQEQSVKTAMKVDKIKTSNSGYLKKFINW